MANYTRWEPIRFYALWSFTEAVWIHEMARPELVADYKAKAVKVGYPNFKT